MTSSVSPAASAVLAVLVVIVATVLAWVAIGRVVAAMWLLPAWAAQLAGSPRRSRALVRCLARTCPRRLRPALWLCEANAFLWEGDFAKAIAVLDTKVRPSNDGALEAGERTEQLLGVVPTLVELEALLFDGRAEQARRLFDAHAAAVRAAREGRPDLFAIEGFLAFHEGRLDAASIHLERALASSTAGDPITSGALFFLAAIAFRRADHPEARRLLGRTIREGGQRFTTAWAESEFAEHYPDLPVPSRAPVVRTGPERPLLDLVRDLRAGLAVAAFRANAFGRRPFTQTRIHRLVVFNLALAAGLHGVGYESGSQVFAIGVLATLAPVLLLLPGAEVGLVRSDRSGRLAVIGALYASLPVFLVLWFAVAWFAPAAPSTYVGEGILGLWALAIYVSRCWPVVAERGRVIATALGLVLTWLVPMHIGATATVFVPADHLPEEAVQTRGEELDDNERDNEVAFDQARRLAEAEAKLLPERPNLTDLYFVGGAGWAAQDVFVRELRSARTLLDEDFGTEGRSILLANARTDRRLPALANVTLGHALRTVGRIMNPDEDVLFLFLTSHGSSEGLAFDFGERGGFRREILRPADLRAMLDVAGIRWRVLVISGCESGTFIAPLRDEQTLAFTAASDDRPSYGCADGSAFTDFGRALFAEELPRNRSLLTAFPNVAKTIGAREADERRLASRPQLSQGARVAEKLAELEKQLASAPVRASVPPPQR